MYFDVRAVSTPKKFIEYVSITIDGFAAEAHWSEGQSRRLKQNQTN